MGLWSDPSPASRFDRPRKGATHADAVERLKAWTRERFALGEADPIVVTEAARSLPGFPPVETVVGFWTGNGTRHHYRVFKPAADVLQADLPPAWLKDSLAWDGFDCDCC